MKTVHVDDVAERVCAAVQAVNFNTPGPIMNWLRTAVQQERSTLGRQALEEILDNRRISARRRIPMCQDAGMIVVFAELGQSVRLIGGDLRTAITSGVRQGSRDGYLRKSVVTDPLFDRRNTGDNTPAIIHFDLVPGETLRLGVMAKGFGAENMGWVKVLTPAQGVEEVKRQVVRSVEAVAPNACPPIVVGLGIGGTLEVAALLAKKALTRPQGQRHEDPRYAELELELLDMVNAIGIGPQGWGGLWTAMDVRVEYAPTHMAAIPLAMNLDCHLQRHIEIVM